MASCEKNLLDAAPVVTTQPADSDLVLFTSAGGTSVLRTWATIKQWINAPLGQQPPTANAGADQTISLPTNTISLSGSGSSVGGTIVSYHWTRISGDAGAVISSPNSASTAVNGLIQGSYVFQLTVTDNLGVQASDTVGITVNAATAPSYDTTITFVTSVSGSAQGVNVTTAFTSLQLKVRFNAISPRVGTPHTMNVYVNGASNDLLEVLDYASDYDGRAIEITKGSGEPVLLTFTNGDVHI
jgi:hypothetical protein